MNIKVVVRNVLAVVAGVVVGGVVNMLLVTIGPSIIPLPEGADTTTMESFAESMKLFSPIDFLFPFLAHALGTLVGAFVTAKLAVSHNLKLAMLVGVCYLIGGIAAIKMLGGPLWFKAADLILAYIPMAWLGAKIAGKS